MKIVLPVYLTCEKLDWLSSPLRQNLLSRLEGLHSFGLCADILLFTDTSFVQQAAGRFGYTVELCDKPDCSSLHKRALSLLREDLIDSGEPIMVLDFRTVGLTVRDMEKAREAYENRPDLSVISVERPQDNPVQFQATYTVQTAGILHLLDNENVRREIRAFSGRPVEAVSRPFPLRLGAEGQMEEKGSTIVRMDETLVRRGWTISLEEGTTGISDPPDGPILRNDMLWLSDYPGAVVRLVPFTSRGIDSSFPLVVVPGSGATEFPEPGQDVCGYLYTVESHVGTGAFGTTTSMTDNGAFCSRNICGRQDFPEVFKYDESLCLGTLEQLRCLDDAMDSGAVQRITYYTGAAFKVLTPLDVLRLGIREKKLSSSEGQEEAA